eukprot:SAG22_NODE_13481_length_405_cov_0.771242_1_plen_51_part_01
MYHNSLTTQKVPPGLRLWTAQLRARLEEKYDPKIGKEQVTATGGIGDGDGD